MRKIVLALTQQDYELLIAGQEVVEPVRPLSGLVTERRISEIFDVHIRLADSVLEKIRSK